MNPPTLSPQQAKDRMDYLISGWAQYSASEQQLAELRAIRNTLTRILNPDLRMKELMMMDGRISAKNYLDKDYDAPVNPATVSS